MWSCLEKRPTRSHNIIGRMSSFHNIWCLQQIKSNLEMEMYPFGSVSFQCFIQFRNIKNAVKCNLVISLYLHYHTRHWRNSERSLQNCPRCRRRRRTQSMATETESPQKHVFCGLFGFETAWTRRKTEIIINPSQIWWIYTLGVGFLPGCIVTTRTITCRGTILPYSVVVFGLAIFWWRKSQIWWNESFREKCTADFCVVR